MGVRRKENRGDGDDYESMGSVGKHVDANVSCKNVKGGREAMGRWLPPPHGVIKVNYDVATFLNNCVGLVVLLKIGRGMCWLQLVVR